MRRGRPVRFLALVLGGWTIARVAMLWPSGVVRGPQAAAMPRAVLAEELEIGPGEASTRDGPPALRPSPASDLAGEGYPPPMDPVAARYSRMQRALPMRPAPRDGGLADVVRPAATTAGWRRELAAVEPSATVPPPYSVGTLRIAGTVAPSSRFPRRLRADAWLVARPGGGDTLAFGQLGASQAGVRVTYALDPARRVALSGRVSAPLRGRGREAAAGLDWQPLPLPVHLLAEARVPLDGGGMLPAVQLIGGGAVRLPLALQAEGYAQAGVVAERGGFADGSLRVARSILSLGRARVDAGAGSWGAVQRGLARVDVGPTAGVTLPIGTATVRVGVDYRFRVAGQARPGSGPAVTVGSSF